MSLAKGEILEGFLCPICMQDLTSITQLQAHFDEQHEAENKAVLQSLKGFLNKAKKKLLNEEQDIEGNFSQRLKNPFIGEGIICNNPWEWDNTIGAPARSHTAYFKKIRSARIDSCVAETNKLLIRLDKLMNQNPSDSMKRKAFEKDLVPWIENKDVPLCPFCARSFHLARRRHHCRLCGAIMCDECSQFLSFSFAQKLISPVHQGISKNALSVNSAEDRRSSHSTIGSLFGGLKRSGSHGSLNSLMAVMDLIGKEQHFRICSHCLARLNARDKQVDQKSFKPLLSVYYEKLMEYRNQMTNYLPQYFKMVESLRDGETTYNLHDAEDLRRKILRISDGISMTAQKIRDLGASGVAFDQEITSAPDGTKVPAEPRQDLLQKRIYSSTVSFLKDNILGLPKLPSLEEVDARRKRRREEMNARLAAEREAAKQAEERAAMILKKKKATEELSRPQQINVNTSTTSNVNVYLVTNRKPVEEVSVDTGWLAETTAHNVTESDDPMVQQMNIIRNYIKQARDASRYDEVSILEANLKELQMEFKNQQRLMES